jgi:hypothetical protein
VPKMRRSCSRRTASKVVIDQSMFGGFAVLLVSAAVFVPHPSGGLRPR